MADGGTELLGTGVESAGVYWTTRVTGSLARDSLVVSLALAQDPNATLALKRSSTRTWLKRT